MRWVREEMTTVNPISWSRSTTVSGTIDKVDELKQARNKNIEENCKEDAHAI